MVERWDDAAKLVDSWVARLAAERRYGALDRRLVIVLMGLDAADVVASEQALDPIEKRQRAAWTG